MTTLAVTNTLSNGATIIASDHNTNYSDIVNYINNRNSGSATWDGCSVASGSVVPVILNNSSGTQDIFRAQDNGSNVMVIPDGGIITMGSQSAARAYRGTSNQTINSGSAVKVQFNAESYDVKSEFDSATNFRFTATKTGKYLVSSTLGINSPSAGTSTIYIYKNGSEFSRATYSMANVLFLTIMDILALTATDYVEIFTEVSVTDAVVFGENLSYVSVHKVA